MGREVLEDLGVLRPASQPAAAAARFTRRAYPFLSEVVGMAVRFPWLYLIMAKAWLRLVLTEIALGARTNA